MKVGDNIALDLRTTASMAKYCLTRQLYCRTRCGGLRVGELFFGALFTVLFFVPMPERFFWARNRYLFFSVGLAALLMATGKWIEAAADRSKIPWGSLWQGLGMDGDLNRLRDEFGWTEGEILYSYLVAAGLSWSVVVLMFLLAARVRGDKRV